MLRDQISSPVEVLVSVNRDAKGRLGAQIEDQLRRAVRTGKAKPGTRLPSTRDLAGQLGVSRHVVVEAYSQLAAEGYLILRQGARPRVSDAVAATGRLAPSSAPRPTPVRFDFRPSVPEVAEFPRAAWLRAMREAIGAIPDADLQYGDPAGVWALRSELANYLGRVRGVVAGPLAVVVTTGYTQGLAIACRALAATGRRRIALEDPTNPEYRQLVARAGLEPVPLPVDAKLYLPGFAFTRSMNSFTVFTSITAGLIVSTLDTSMRGATGVKSASTSKGSLR